MSGCLDYLSNPLVLGHELKTLLLGELLLVCVRLRKLILTGTVRSLCRGNKQLLLQLART